MPRLLKVLLLAAVIVLALAMVGSTLLLMAGSEPPDPCRGTKALVVVFGITPDAEFHACDGFKELHVTGERRGDTYVIDVEDATPFRSQQATGLVVATPRSDIDLRWRVADALSPIEEWHVWDGGRDDANQLSDSVAVAVTDFGTGQRLTVPLGAVRDGDEVEVDVVDVPPSTRR